MSKKLTEQEKKARLARRAARLSKFPPIPPRQLGRKEARAIAHANMERAGVTRINKKNSKKQSFFSLYWRKYIVPTKKDRA
jgi:hypothetical protein